MHKKKILAIIPTYYPQCGGAEKAAHELYAGISKEYKVDLLCPDYGGKKNEFNGFFYIHRVCKTTKNLPFKVIKYQLFQFLKGCTLFTVIIRFLVVLPESCLKKYSKFLW